MTYERAKEILKITYCERVVNDSHFFQGNNGLSLYPILMMCYTNQSINCCLQVGGIIVLFFGGRRIIALIGVFLFLLFLNIYCYFLLVIHIQCCNVKRHIM